MTDQRWLLGVDGGGSKTAVHIACLENGKLRVVAKATGHASNLRALGAATALANLDEAIDRALASTPGVQIDRAVLALAGSQTREAKSRIEDWAAQRKLATHVRIAHDIDPVLAIAAAHPKPLALIAGTGSAAGALNAEGRQVVVGGWGHWIGDRGSAFDIGRQAIAAVADAADGIGPETALAGILLEHFDVDSPRRIVTRLAGVDARSTIASCAVHVTTAAESDAVARRIVDAAANDAAKLMLAAADKAGTSEGASLAVAGGVVCGSELYRTSMLDKLGEAGMKPSHVEIVKYPVEGCLSMAMQEELA